MLKAVEGVYRDGKVELLETPPDVHHPNAIGELRATVVIPYTSTARPYLRRPPRHS
jgi:hypothetical protein